VDVIQSFIEKIRGRSLSVVLPEGRDERVIAAARRMKDEGIAEPIVLGKPAQLAAAATAAGVGLDGISVIDPAGSAALAAYAASYARKRRLEVKIARRVVMRPLCYAGMMVSAGHADTLVAGVASPTALVIQAGVLTVGLAAGIDTPSSFFLMILPEFQGVPDRPFIYADCAVNVMPTPRQLADIAIASAASAARLLDEEPRVAMLSFSTKGSAAHPAVDRVTEALAIVKQKAAGLKVDGELQIDAAILASVGAKKVKEPSPVVGRANVLIFPDLNSGNIAYKLTQYMAGAKAIGPFLQGFARPISDLSRGASVNDIVAAAAICLVQASEEEDHARTRLPDEHTGHQLRQLVDQVPVAPHA
jgi:phosphate acetyltransferase